MRCRYATSGIRVASFVVAEVTTKKVTRTMKTHKCIKKARKVGCRGGEEIDSTLHSVVEYSSPSPLGVAHTLEEEEEHIHPHMRKSKGARPHLRRGRRTPGGGGNKNRFGGGKSVKKEKHEMCNQ